MMLIMGLYYDIWTPDRGWWPIGRMTSNPQYILDLVTDAIGSMLYRAEIGWVGVPPGDPGQVLTLTPDGPQWMTPSGGGGSEWTLIDDITVTTPVTEVAFDLSALNQVILVCRGLTASAGVQRHVQASTDGGGSWISGATSYRSVGANGSGTNVNWWMAAQSNSSAGLDLITWIPVLRTPMPNRVAFGNFGGQVLLTQTEDPVDAIRVIAPGNTINAGRLQLWGM
jgi:hypothetical protein